eukprot:TRINITY_DN15078_c1_g3_i1.p1 TRINITY_DN15078_c1_g3~~TRINITY_DN15078_c1_g3_i1.p1  ORF type:complete len:430 (+),score=113.64 TRINITY_DN15078_c1_g3_i1:61-1290(+)
MHLRRTCRRLLRRGQVRRHALKPDPSAKALETLEKFFTDEATWKQAQVASAVYTVIPSPEDMPGLDFAPAGHWAVDKVGDILMPESRFYEILDVRQRIEELLREKLDERLDVHTLGSIMSGLCTAASDLDIVIVRPGRDPVTRSEQIEHLQQYGDILRLSGLFPQVELISARVPILRCMSHSRVQVDFGLYIHGIRNSVVLREYARKSPYFLPMSLLLREWCKSVNVCNSPNRYLTPYCINLMLIKFLVKQEPRCHVPIPELLPPSYYPTHPKNYLKPSYMFLQRHPGYVYQLAFLVAGFFRYYAVFNFFDRVISAADPSVPDSRSQSPLWRDESDKKDIVIEEMHAADDSTLPIPNVASNVDILRLYEIKECFFSAYLYFVTRGFLPRRDSVSIGPRNEEWKFGDVYN